MVISGTLTDDELIEYIGLRLKLETIVNFVNSRDYTDSEKVAFMKIYFKEAEKSGL